MPKLSARMKQVVKRMARGDALSYQTAFGRRVWFKDHQNVPMGTFNALRKRGLLVIKRDSWSFCTVTLNRAALKKMEEEKCKT